MSMFQGHIDRVFRIFANRGVRLIGSSVAFIAAVLFLAGWLIAGALQSFSNQWWLFFSVILSSITFLIVFLIQNSQNRDTKAIQIKLDELIRAIEGARTNLVRLEDLGDNELQALQDEFEGIRATEVTQVEQKVQEERRAGQEGYSQRRPQTAEGRELSRRLG